MTPAAYLYRLAGCPPVADAIAELSLGSWQTAKAATARENGKRGGRPRKKGAGENRGG